MSNSESFDREGRLCRLLDTGGAVLHFCGVRGVSMSSLAEFLAQKGHKVSGSDRDSGEPIPGVIIPRDKYGCVAGADALVYSLAIDYDDGERDYARRCGVAEYSRPELLGALMKRYKSRIGISGTHGKSTTVAMASQLFSCAGLDPTVFSGAVLPSGKSFIHGGEEYFIYEACEYKRAFLHFSPDCAIITNIELDHTDCYSDLEALTDAFIESARGAGRVIISADYPATRRVIDSAVHRVISFGKSPDAHLSYRMLAHSRVGSEFAVSYRNSDLGCFHLGVMGEHNISNAMAVIALALEYGIDLSTLRFALADFRGIARRLEYLGSIGGSDVYYDYAHHPTEIASAISALKSSYGSVGVIFRPHTYTRTRDLWHGFSKELSRADFAVVCDVYGAREEEIAGITSAALAASVARGVALDGREAADYALSHECGAIVLMGAGDMSDIKKIMEDLISKEKIQ